ncbi:MAG: pyridoxal-phosphate dependent enzyme, partial [Pseudomonadota bacterium]
SPAKGVAALLAHCPKHAPTPLVDHPGLAHAAGVAALYIKDERGRMGLGSFKALGAAYKIARDAAARGGPQDGKADLSKALAGETYVTASAGNHGLSVAAGARLFGAQAIIYLANSVPEAFAQRLRGIGAEVTRAGAIYEEAMDTAAADAAREGWSLLSDSTWEGYVSPALAVMEGYMQLAAEAVAQLQAPPSHVLLQAGVGGLAAGVAAHLRHAWGDAPEIWVVEPEAAPALHASIAAGKPVTTQGPVSAMGRLDCKTPSLVALAHLSRDADRFVTLSEAEAQAGTDLAASHDLASTPSGAAGLAALLAGLDGMPKQARVMVILSEGPE